MKDKITLDEKFQLPGLIVLADYHYQHLENINRAAAEIVGARDLGGTDYYGHITDRIYSGEKETVDRLLENMGVSVKGISK